jgi:murein DD-endopeptidase MepM/ murein hydrolase activator NlpD
LEDHPAVHDRRTTPENLVPERTDAAARAYLDLLASTEPLPSPEANAYQALLSSPEPLPSPEATAYRALLSSTEAIAPVVPPAREGRRAHSHRAPARPVHVALLGHRGRQAVLAALVAGVSVAGVSVAGDYAEATPLTNASPAAAQARPTTIASTTAGAGAGAAAVADAQIEAAGVSTGSVAAVDAQIEAAGVSTGGAALGFAPLQRKTKPLPKANWIDPMPAGAVTSCFGPRWGRLHAGVDLAAPSGTPIRAVGAGTVVTAGPADGYGIAVLIDHGTGYLTHYGHMSEHTVTAGQKIKAGEQIGLEGSTGHSTGPHLHFEVHQGAYKNPIEPTAWLRDRGVIIDGCTTTPDPEDTH